MFRNAFNLSAVVATGICAIILAVAPLAAQEYPSKPIRVWIPSSPGGASDVTARILGVRITDVLGQPVLVENRVASGGVFATTQLAKSVPDGYTLMMTFDTFATNPHMFKEMPYDVVRDFTPVMLVTRYPQLLILHPNLNVTTMKDFVAYAKKNGAKMNNGTAGPASSSRLSYELFKEAAGIETTAVHYKGAGPAVQDLMAGQLQVIMITANSSIQQAMKGGKLIGLATSGIKRAPHFPDLPTIADAYPGFETFSWVGMIGPAGLPKPIVDRLNFTLKRILAAQDMKDQIFGQGGEVVASAPDEFADMIRTENNKWGRIIRAKGITID